MYANAANLFQKQGFEFYAIATGKERGDFEPEFIKNGIIVWHLPIVSAKNLIKYIAYVQKMILFVKEHQIDLIHIHRGDVKWIFGLVAKFNGIKSIYTVHNVFRHRKFTWIKGYIDRYTARKWLNQVFQTIGQSVYENEFFYYKTPSVRINNWFDNKKFYPALSSSEKIALRQKIGIPKDNFVLISTGGCSLVKNHHAILSAIALLPNQDSITYLHLGCGKTEQEERSLAAFLGIEQKVHFLGNKINVRDYLIASDLYLMPSKFEGLSIASIEAMACGIPSILYDSPGLRDLIHCDDNGLLINPNIDALKEGIHWIMMHSSEAKFKAENALKYVNTEFFMETNINQIIELYLKLIK